MRQFPLFIVDTSRSHGRGREVDFISCTSKEIPFVGEVTLMDAAALAIDQDWSQKNPLCLYSDERHGIRAKLKVVDYPQDCKLGDLRQLMKRAMKEWLLRRQTVSVDLSDVSTEAILKFCDLLLQQTAENLREDPNDSQAKTVKAILTKIKNDYEQRM